jgi:hypothetical protein
MEGHFPTFFLVVWRGARRHETQKQHMGDLIVNVFDTDKWWGVAPSSRIINF